MLSGFLEAGLHQSAVLTVAGPMVEVQLELVPGENTLAPKVDFGSRTDVGKMKESVFQHNCHHPASKVMPISTREGDGGTR